VTFDLLESAAVLFGIVSVYLSVRENIWSWPTAIVNVTLYAVFLVLSLIGYFRWRKSLQPTP
jgi:nicotinamide riboside transporter PnuC